MRVLLLLGLCLAQPALGVRSFGRGYEAAVCASVPTPFMQHTIADPRKYMGVMDHFWFTGSSQVALAAAGVWLQIQYRFDGEKTPSLAYDPAAANGQHFGAVGLADGKWADGTRDATGNRSMFSAGEKMGKNAIDQAWYNYYKLPFATSVQVSAQLVPRPGATPTPKFCATVYMVLRGHEHQLAGNTAAVTLTSGFSLPQIARMQLFRTELTAKPNAFTPLANVSAAHEALLFQVSIGLETSPPWGTQVEKKLAVRNNYVEGCWHLLRNTTETLPGQVRMLTPCAPCSPPCSPPCSAPRSPPCSFPR